MPEVRIFFRVKEYLQKFWIIIKSIEKVKDSDLKLLVKKCKLKALYNGVNLISKVTRWLYRAFILLMKYIIGFDFHMKHWGRTHEVSVWLSIQYDWAIWLLTWFRGSSSEKVFLLRTSEAWVIVLFLGRPVEGYYWPPKPAAFSVFTMSMSPVLFGSNNLFSCSSFFLLSQFHL